MRLMTGRASALASAIVGISLLATSVAMAQTYSEAPALADAVKAGSLPPVEQRISDNPLVLTPVESVGTYGGTIHNVTKANLDWSKMILQVEPFARWERDLNGIRPNVAESWEWNDACLLYTSRAHET